jgi:malonyl-CoA O-methyltransferase
MTGVTSHLVGTNDGSLVPNSLFGNSIQYKGSGKPCVDQKAQIASGFNKQAKQYDQHAKVQQRIALHALNLLPKPKTDNKAQYLVDLGCGTGACLAHLQQFAGTTIGIDISPDMLNEALIKSATLATTPSISKTVLINADAENLPLSDNSVDLVFSSMALQWCLNPEQLLAQIFRVLKVNGKAVLAILVDGSFNDLHLAYRRLGIPSRVNKFATSSLWLQASNRLDWTVEHTSVSFATEHSSLLDMLRSIKSVGADTKQIPVTNTGLTKQLTTQSASCNSGNDTQNSLTNRLITKKEIEQISKILRANSQVEKPHEKRNDDYINNKKVDKLQLDYRVMFLSLSKQ